MMCRTLIQRSNVPMGDKTIAEPRAANLPWAGGDGKAGRSYALRLYLAMAFYNRACVYAQRREADRAVWDIIEARRMNPAGYPASFLEKERDFDKIREAPAFVQLVK